MNVAILIATFGDPKWEALGQERAYPSAIAEYERFRQPGRPGGVGHVHCPNKTLAEARNFAAETMLTGTEWLCFLDADDELEPGYLAAMEDALRMGAAPVEQPLLIPALRRVWQNGVQTPATIPNRGRWPEVNDACIGTLVHREMFEAVGGFRDEVGIDYRGGDKPTAAARLTMYEDWDLWLRCWDAGAPRLYVEDAVYREHVSPEGRNTDTAYAQAVYDAIWADHERRVAARH